MSSSITSQEANSEEPIDPLKADLTRQLVRAVAIKAVTLFFPGVEDNRRRDSRKRLGQTSDFEDASQQVLFLGDALARSQVEYAREYKSLPIVTIFRQVVAAGKLASEQHVELADKISPKKWDRSWRRNLSVNIELCEAAKTRRLSRDGKPIDDKSPDYVRRVSEKGIYLNGLAFYDELDLDQLKDELHNPHECYDVFLGAYIGSKLF